MLTLTQKQHDDLITCLGTWGCAALSYGICTGNLPIAAGGAASFCAANEMVTGSCQKGATNAINAATSWKNNMMGMGATTEQLPSTPPPAYVPQQKKQN